MLLQKRDPVQQAENWVFYFLSGFALFSSLSIAVGNIFLSLVIAAGVWRLYYKHDDGLPAIFFQPIGVWAALAGVLVTAVLSSVLSPDPIWGLRLCGDYYGYRMLGFYAVLLMIHDKQKLLWLAGLTMTSFFLNNLHCIWEGIMRTASNPSGRAGGFMDAIMSTAGCLSMGTALCLLLALSAKKSCWRKFGWSLFMVSAVALFYNGTRGAWMAGAFTVVVIWGTACVSKRQALLVGILLFVSVGALFVGDAHFQERVESMTVTTKYRSNTERILLWTSAYHMFEDAPFFGIGFGQFETAYPTKYILPAAQERTLGHAHSNVMQMLAERGALGCIAFLWMWFYFMYFGLQGWRRYRQPVYLAFFAIVAGLMIQGLTEYNMGNSVVTKLFWFSLGICLQWMRISWEEKIL